MGYDWTSHGESIEGTAYKRYDEVRIDSILRVKQSNDPSGNFLLLPEKIVHTNVLGLMGA